MWTGTAEGVAVASKSSRGSSFRRLWLVGLFVRVADGVRGVALPWLVLVQTGSPFQLGVTLALGAVDALLGPVVGPLVDRLPRRTVVGAGVVGYGVTLLALAAATRLGDPGIVAVHTAAVGVSVSQFVYHNARHAWLPELVTDLDAANAAVHGTGAAARAAFLLFGGAVTTLARRAPRTRGTRTSVRVGIWTDRVRGADGERRCTRRCSL